MALGGPRELVQSEMVAMIEKNGQILKKMAQGAEPSDLADELADLLVGA